MKKKMMWIMVTCLMALSLVVVSCGQAEEEEEAPPPPPPEEEEPVDTGPVAPYGTIRGTSSDFSLETFDPNNISPTWEGAMYDRVMNWDPQGNNIGEAAASWTVSDDGRTWTFKVRAGMKFHNGDPVTSADFKWSIDRFMLEDSTNPWAPRVRENFASSSTPDELIYVHTTNTPELTLVASFARLPILPSKYIEENGMDYFMDHPIGSGAWKVVELVTETSIEFEANLDYWDGAPFFEKLIEYQVPEEATRVAMMKRGEVDAIFVSTDRLIELRDDGYRLEEVGLPTVGNINFSGWWMTDGPLSDIRVRQALSYSINRQEISDTFYQGLAKPGSRWFMSDVTWGWDPNWVPDPFDPDRAAQLLEDAGYPEAFSTPTIGLFTAANNADLMTILQGYWDEAGIDVDIEILEMAKYFDLIFVRATDPEAEVVAKIWPWMSANTFQNVYHSSNMYTSIGVHTTANDPVMDDLYDAVLAETDPDKQKQMWTDFTAQAYDMWVSVGLVQLPTNWVISDQLGEFSKNSHLGMRESYAGIKHP